MEPPTLYLFGGSNGAGQTTFARAYLTTGFEIPLRFLNADELARGLSPLAPQSVALKAGKLLLSEISGCFRDKASFGLESTLSGHAQVAILKKAKSLGYRIELHYLWIPSPTLGIHRIAQRVKKGGHSIPSEDVRRRYSRSLKNLSQTYAPLADLWKLWDNAAEPAKLILRSDRNSIAQLEAFLNP